MSGEESVGGRVSLGYGILVMLVCLMVLLSVCAGKVCGWMRAWASRVWAGVMAKMRCRGRGSDIERAAAESGEERRRPTAHGRGGGGQQQQQQQAKTIKSSSTTRSALTIAAPDIVNVEVANVDVVGVEEQYDAQKMMRVCKCSCGAAASCNYNNEKPWRCQEEEEECCICMEALNYNKMRRAGDDNYMQERLHLLPTCGHVFHAACLAEWLPAHSSCPLCRAPSPSSTPAIPLLLLRPSAPPPPHT